MRDDKHSIKKALYSRRVLTPEERVRNIMQEVNFIYGPPQQVLNEGFLDWFGNLFKSILGFFQDLLGFEPDAGIEGLTPTQAELAKAFQKGTLYVDLAKMAIESENYPSNFDKYVDGLAADMGLSAIGTGDDLSISKWSKKVEASTNFMLISNAMALQFGKIQTSAQNLNNAYADALEGLSADLNAEDLVSRLNIESKSYHMDSNILLEQDDPKKPVTKEPPTAAQLKKAEDKLKDIKAGLKKRADDVFRVTLFAEVAAGGVVYGLIENVLNSALGKSIGREGRVRIDSGVQEDLTEAIDGTIKKAMAKRINSNGLNSFLKKSDFKRMAEKLNQAAASENPVNYFAAVYAAYKIRTG